MTVFADLTREHRLFQRLLERLRSTTGLEAPLARRLAARALTTALDALERHDLLEDRLFGETRASSPQEERWARELVDAQHETLRELRREIARVLADEETATLARLKALTGALCDKLRWHFETEERLLWPLLAKRCGRSIGHSLQRQAAANSRELAAQLDVIESRLNPRGSAPLPGERPD